jgi:hypothetical protein
MAGEVVGRGSTGGTITATTATPPGQSTFIKNINDRLNSTGLGGITNMVNVTVNDAVASLTNAQKKQIGAILDKAGFTVRTPAEVDYVLATSFPNLVFRDFPDLLRQVKENLIGKAADTGPSTSMAITEYGKEQIDNWLDEGLKKKFGRGLGSLDDAEMKTLRKAVEDYVKTPSVTTTKKVDGKTVTTTKPGVTTAGIEQAIETAGMPMFADEAERRKAFEFSNIINKTLGVGSI